MLLIFVVMTQLNAQEKSNLVDCRKISVQDSDKRGFDDLESFTLDVDGDGKPDTITPRTYAVKNNRKVAGRHDPQAREIHWIAFDLKISQGRVMKSFFKYDFGTDLANFYVYVLLPCKINQGTRTDFLFYSGDEQSDEIIILENKGNLFKVRSRKTEGFE